MKFICEDEISDLKFKLKIAVETLRNVIDIAEDVIGQESGGGPQPSYFNEKWGWSDGIRKAKETLERLK